MVSTSALSTDRRALLEELRSDISGYIYAGLSAGGAVLFLVAEQARLPLAADVLGFVLLCVPLLGLLLRERSARAGAWLTVSGCLVVCLLALRWFPSVAHPALLAVPGGLAVLLLGPGSGLLIAVFSTVVTYMLVQTSASEHTWLLGMVTLWCCQALMWVSLRFSEQTLESLWRSYTRMHELLEEARDQRLELKQTQDDLIKANAQLALLSDRLSAMYHIAEDARRAKEEFVANVSHELRTPLNMIIGYSQMITQTPEIYGADLPKSLLADLAVVRRNSEHLAALVDDVLDLSQVDTGQMAIIREWVALPDLVAEAVVAVRPLFDAKSLSLTASIPEDLPLVYCDRTRIRQVLLNLLSNAGRFTERGGAHITLQRDDRHVIVSVSDSGPGIPPAKQALIFEPFQQADGSIRRRFGGSGLGLSISKRFVEMHGGTMRLESQPGQGTTFHFTLPLQEPTHDGRSVGRWFSPYQEYEPRERPSKAPIAQPVPRFVVVETGCVLQRLLRRYMPGIDVASARTMREAITELERLPAQALIMNGPDMDSDGDNMQNLPFGTPVFRCWVPGEEEAAERLGVVRYLLKPVTRETLVSALDVLGGDVKTVLIVDDEPDVLQLFGRILSSAGRGYRVLRASSGQQALAMLRERHPSVMLLDMIMPGTDGYAVLCQKALDPSISTIPVIAVTGRDPIGQAVVSNTLTLSRGGGLTLRDLLASIRALSEIMTQSEK